jgi:NAD(P)H-hydrate epimerase
MACQAAFRVGSGYVVLASHDLGPELVKIIPEAMTEKLDHLQLSDKFAYGVGPGLGVGNRTLEFIQKLQTAKISKVVLDADAISAISPWKKNNKLPSGWIITPHAAELSRLIGISVEKINRDPYSAALATTELTGAIVLLKGFHTLVASAHRVFVVPTGNAALAKAGTGDVLTGIITGLLAQGVQPLRAAGFGAYLHGKIADDWIRLGNDKRSLMATDLISLLPRALTSISQGVSL